MSVLFNILFLSVFSQVHAAECPTGKKPGHCVDQTLTQGLPAREFFEKRAQDAACMADLKRARTEYRALRDQIRRLLAARKPNTKLNEEDAQYRAANDAIDQKEEEANTKRAELLVHMEKCGECATNEVIREERSTVAGDEIWYISDGSCQLPAKDPAVLTAAFKTISGSLVHAKQYPKHVDNGFGNILEFQLAQGTRFQPAGDAFPPSPVNLGIWVLGPLYWGKMALAFQYFLKATYATVTYAGVEEFALDFATDPKVSSKVTFPTVFNVGASGRKAQVTPVTLQQVQGMWYVTADGYLRYQTKAEFSFAMSFLKKINYLEKLGRNILIDTLVELSERGKWDRQ